MGAMLSNCFNFNSKKSRNDQAHSSTDHQAQAFSIIELVKPECLKTKKKIIKKKKKKKKNDPQERSEVIVRRKLTLEDMLLASPGSKFKPNHNNGSGELHVSKHFSKRVHPSSSSAAAGSSEAIRKVKIGEEILAHKQDVVTSNSTTTCTSMDVQISQKVKKRVSFKLPEEADIFVYYYSSEEKLDNYSL